MTSEALTKKILDAMPEAILALAENQTVLFASQAAADLLGRSPKEIEGARLDDCINDRNLRLLTDGLDLGNYLEKEIEVSYPRNLQLKLQIIPLGKPASEKEPYSLVIFRDVSHDLARLSDRERIASLEKAGRMSAQMAHELGNRLHPIMGQAAMLERDLQKLPASDVKQKISERIGVIREESDRIRDFIHNFLSAARRRETTFVETDLQKLCHEVLEALAPELDSLHIILEERLHKIPLAQLDPQSWRDALINVLRNALEAMPEGGHLIVTLECKGEEIRLSVRDTGCGMSEETLAHAFDPFYTTKEKGHGLGMLQIRQAMEAHGGTVEIRSRGRGTIVTLVAPLYRGAHKALAYKEET